MVPSPPHKPTALTTIPRLKARRLGIDTHSEPVVYLHQDSTVCRSEGFENQVRVAVHTRGRTITATLNRVTSSLLHTDDAGFSEAAWRLLSPVAGEFVLFTPATPLESFAHVRGKVFGRSLSSLDLEGIIGDIAGGRYGDVHLSAFLTACGGNRMNLEEITDLTLVMAKVGDRLVWDSPVVMDKHCVGGLPGNRTTPLVVAILTAAGRLMPKTSSRAITSAAGTADTMEVLTNVDLSLARMRRVVKKAGGCLAWGGSANLSPADDMLIRVERQLDLDSEAQLVASVLSKKLAAGSTHVLLDIPVGSSAKVRSYDAALHLGNMLKTVGHRVGLTVEVVVTDGSQPVGRGIGPALEALDILAVLHLEEDAPQDLRERSLLLAARLLEMSGAPQGQGLAQATELLDNGRALDQFQRICSAQGALKTPPVANLRHPFKAAYEGRVTHIDNRKIARVAKLAGAPEVHAAGVVLHTPLGTLVQKGQPLFTLHADTKGELAYALSYCHQHPDILSVEPTP